MCMNSFSQRPNVDLPTLSSNSGPLDIKDERPILDRDATICQIIQMSTSPGCKGETSHVKSFRGNQNLALTPDLPGARREM
ncbi:hypothetical protein ElyMa_005101500 [Elysia marginata]|uniref:Uncharacterized protein n=1 Tax=Elysia marginata TaxID=1093978 RepID=A0AAV4JK78_9GAST|nr:hypothetical protein ElyMa_005101500 [Elysia marginata]